MLNVDNSNGFGIVPGACSHNIKAAFENICPSIEYDSFAQRIRDSNNCLNRQIDVASDHQPENLSSQLEAMPTKDDPSDDTNLTSPIDIPSANDLNTSVKHACGSDDAALDQLHNINDGGTAVAQQAQPNATEILMPKHSTSDNVEAFWPMENVFYTGIIAEEQEGTKNVIYDDGQIETLDFANETMRLASSANIMSISPTSIRLESDTPAVMETILNYFRNRPFLKYQAQVIPSYLLFNAYTAEDAEFKRTVQVTALAKVRNYANIISIRTIYKKNLIMISHWSLRLVSYRTRTETAQCLSYERTARHDRPLVLLL